MSELGKDVQRDRKFYENYAFYSLRPFAEKIESTSPRPKKAVVKETARAHARPGVLVFAAILSVVLPVCFGLESLVLIVPMWILLFFLSLFTLSSDMQGKLYSKSKRKRELSKLKDKENLEWRALADEFLAAHQDLARIYAEWVAAVDSEVPNRTLISMLEKEYDKRFSVYRESHKKLMQQDLENREIEAQQKVELLRSELDVAQHGGVVLARNKDQSPISTQDVIRPTL